MPLARWRLDAEVEAQEPEIAHVESLLHGRLELLRISAGDDEVVDVDPNQQQCYTVV